MCFDAFPYLTGFRGFISGKDLCAQRSNEGFTSAELFPHFLPHTGYRQDRVLGRRVIKVAGRDSPFGFVEDTRTALEAHVVWGLFGPCAGLDGMNRRCEIGAENRRDSR